MTTLTHARLLEVVSYDPETGVFTNLLQRSTQAVGAQVGYMENDGYLRARIDGERFALHRLAWFFMHGQWPANQIDHRNCIRHDNRFSNLRECTYAQNAQNRTPRHGRAKGVGFHPDRGRYHVAIGKRYVGWFDTAEEAAAAYDRAAVEAFGEFARTNDMGAHQ